MVNLHKQMQELRLNSSMGKMYELLEAIIDRIEDKPVIEIKEDEPMFESDLPDKVGILEPVVKRRGRRKKKDA